MSSAGLPPTTTVVEDLANTYAWTSISSTYDAFGFLTARETVMDNGRTTSETFFGPQRLSFTETDTAANTANWDSRTTEWNFYGQKTARTITYDNGDQRIERYDPDTGFRIQRTEIDGNDDKNWTSLTTTYDADTHVRIGLEKVLDNGRIDITTFDADSGARTSRTIIDGADKAGWHSRSFTYDADTGQLTSSHVVQDDGRSDLVTYNNGRLASMVQTDGSSDTFEWQTRETTYDSNGRIALVEEVQDDGDLIVSSYAGGRITDETTYDNSGNEAWHVQEVSYDSNGNVTDTTYYDEIGNILIL